MHIPTHIFTRHTLHSRMHTHTHALGSPASLHTYVHVHTLTHTCYRQSCQPSYTHTRTRTHTHTHTTHFHILTHVHTHALTRQAPASLYAQVEDKEAQDPGEELHREIEKRRDTGIDMQQVCMCLYVCACLRVYV